MRRNPEGFWTVWTSVAVDLLGFGIIIPLLPLYAESFGATPLAIGMLFASYSLAQLVFSPLWGRVSDRIGRRPVLLVTIAGSAIGSLVVGLAGSLAILFVGRILDGMSGASIAVARATVADAAPPRERSRLMGLLGAAFGIGFVVGPIIGSLAALGGPSLPFLIAAGISIINLVVGLFRIPETRPDVSAAVVRPEVSLRSQPSTVVRLVLLTFVGVTAFSVFEATLALLGDRRLGMTQSVVALLFAGVGLVLILTQGALVGLMSRRLGEAGLMRTGLGLNVLGFGVLAVAGGWTMLILAVGGLAVGQGLLTPALSSAVAGSAADGRMGTALGFQQSAGGLARVVGPALGGFLFAAGTSLPYVVAAGITLVALPLVPGVNGRRVLSTAEMHRHTNNRHPSGGSQSEVEHHENR